jgi:hypothetical protein
LTRKTARTIFGAALALYLLWVAALLAMALVSGSRPSDARRPMAPAPADPPAEREPP